MNNLTNICHRVVKPNDKSICVTIKLDNRYDWTNLATWLNDNSVTGDYITTIFTHNHWSIAFKEYLLVFNDNNTILIFYLRWGGEKGLLIL